MPELKYEQSVQACLEEAADAAGLGDKAFAAYQAARAQAWGLLAVAEQLRLLREGGAS